MFEWETAVETSPIRDSGFVASTTLESARAAMVQMYERLPFVLKPRLVGAFHAIVHAGEGATIIHCTAGKDRTGVAVALVLDTLGVPRETIVADYLYTNEAVDLGARLLGEGIHGAGVAATDEPIRALRDHARAAVLEAHPTYLAATFAAVESRHGSIERYLREELQLEPELLEELRRRLLE
jgi:protein-tyrosine phosphatase